MKVENSFDVCVVGSGPGGGISAYILAKAGLKVALLEAGPRLRAGVDFGSHQFPYQEFEKRLQGRLRGSSNNLFGERQERNHFTPEGDNPQHGWLKAVGGRSLCWAGHSLRFGPKDFRTWPVSYDEIAPYYSKAERFMGVYGYKDGLWNMPDGEFTRPVRMRCPEMALKESVENLKKRGRKMEFVAQRKAMLTAPNASGRALCHYCGKCGGCEVDAKYTSANTPIPAGIRTGNLKLFENAMMVRIVMDQARHRVTGVEYADSTGAITGAVRCKALVVACNSIETPRQLLLAGLANSSGQIGRNLTSHFGVTVTGFFPQTVKRDFSNDDGTGYYHSLLTGLYWDEPSKEFEGTYQVQCGAGISPFRFVVRDVGGFGSSFKRELLEKNIGHVNMNMQGSTQVTKRTFVDLDRDKKDKNGLPVARVHLHYTDSDLAMARDMVKTCEEIIRNGKGEVISSPREIAPRALVIDLNHWVGTCRMGNDPKTSVVNRFGQSHDIPNLFVGDAGVFATYPEKNPTLTNITLSWRMSDYLADKMKKSEI